METHKTLPPAQKLNSVAGPSQTPMQANPLSPPITDRCLDGKTKKSKIQPPRVADRLKDNATMD